MVKREENNAKVPLRDTDFPRVKLGSQPAKSHKITHLASVWVFESEVAGASFDAPATDRDGLAEGMTGSPPKWPSKAEEEIGGPDPRLRLMADR